MERTSSPHSSFRIRLHRIQSYWTGNLNLSGSPTGMIMRLKRRLLLLQENTSSYDCRLNEKMNSWITLPLSHATSTIWLVYLVNCNCRMGAAVWTSLGLCLSGTPSSTWTVTESWKIREARASRPTAIPITTKWRITNRSPVSATTPIAVPGDDQSITG